MVFDDVTAATNALRQMQGFPFYDKPMVSAFFLFQRMVSLFVQVLYETDSGGKYLVRYWLEVVTLKLLFI